MSEKYRFKNVVILGRFCREDSNLAPSKTSSHPLGLATCTVMRVGTRRAVRARWPNGDADTGTGYEMTKLPLFPREHDAVASTRNFATHPADWPGVFWLDEPEGGATGGAWADRNAAGTGRWAGFSGGLCSGRQAPYGFWCSANNTRSQLTPVSVGVRDHLHDADWGQIDSHMNKWPEEHMNLTQWWNVSRP